MRGTAGREHGTASSSCSWLSPTTLWPVSVGRAALQEPVSGATPAWIDDMAMLTVGWGPWEDEKKCGRPLNGSVAAAGNIKHAPS